MNLAQKNAIRLRLLLELNSCFSNTSKHYAEYGTDEEREFLAKLVEAVRNYVKGAAWVEPDPGAPGSDQVAN